jgi:hypothetical protein
VSLALLGRPISEFDELPKPHKVNIIRDRKRKLLGKGHGETRLGRAGQRVRSYHWYADSGQYSEYEITSVCGVSGGKQPYLVTKQGGSSALEGVKRGTTYVALSAIDVDGGLVRENGLTQYEGSLVHRALHYRKAPKRKIKRAQSLVEQPTGMAAGVLGVRRCSRSVACDVMTVEGGEITKSPAQLFATYDVKGPITYPRTNEETTCQEE